MRTSVRSRPQRSAIPAQTPATIRPSRGRTNSGVDAPGADGPSRGGIAAFSVMGRPCGTATPVRIRLRYAADPGPGLRDTSGPEPDPHGGDRCDAWAVNSERAAPESGVPTGDPSAGAVPVPLIRRTDGRHIAGVCGGIAAQLGVNVTLVRWVFALLGANGIGVVAYLALWFFVPADDDDG